MARAADEMVSWNKWQAIIAAITTFLLGLTFWITRSAVIEARNTTRAAVDAARAAEEQVRLSREALIAEERAWIFVEIAIESGFAISETEISIKVSVHVRNIGKTPALEVYTTLRLVPATQYGQDQIKAFTQRCAARRTTIREAFCSPEKPISGTGRSASARPI
jgi:hypothetical protein